MIVNVMVAAVPSYPSLPFQPCCHPASVRLEGPLGQPRRSA
jgi:hypothetical protein